LINLWIAERLQSLPAEPGTAVHAAAEVAEKILAEGDESYSV